MGKKVSALKLHQEADKKEGANNERFQIEDLKKSKKIFFSRRFGILNRKIWARLEHSKNCPIRNIEFFKIFDF